MGSEEQLPTSATAARPRATAARDPALLAALRATIASRRSVRGASTRAARVPQAPAGLPLGLASQQALPADASAQASSVGGRAEAIAAHSTALRAARSAATQGAASEAQPLEAKAGHARAVPIAGQRRANRRAKRAAGAGLPQLMAPAEQPGVATPAEACQGSLAISASSTTETDLSEVSLICSIQQTERTAALKEVAADCMALG